METFLNFLLHLDTHLFLFLNQGIANRFFDIVMPFITTEKNWRIPIAVVWLLLVIKGGKRGRIVALLVIPTLILTDQLSAAVFKPLVGRIRPCHALDQVRLLVNCGGRYAFPSSHATNIAGAATIFALFYRRFTFLFVFIAFTVGFSRIYVGVHYPFDVLAGFILGSASGLSVFYLFNYLNAQYLKISLD